MNEQIKQEWIDALRSGEYEQGKGSLRDRDQRYCCLGVLCDLAVKHGVIQAPTYYEDVDQPESFGLYIYEGQGGLLPQSVVQWSGLSNNTGGFGDKFQRQTLVDMNDGGASFETIADIIEDNF